MKLRLLAGALAVQGKLAEANRVWATVSQRLVTLDAAGQVLKLAAISAIPTAMYGGDRAAAAVRLDEVLRTIPLGGVKERQRPLFDLIQAEVTLGRTDRAKALLAELEHNPGDRPSRIWKPSIAQAKAMVLALDSASLPTALAEYRHTSTTAACSYCVEAPMAEAFARAGMPDSALAIYERWAGRGEWLWEYGVANFWQPVAWFQMGELYEAKGDKARALEYYGKFTDIWRNADPELQPKVAEAKRRIAALSAEPRT